MNDFLLNDEDEMIIENGDFATAQSDDQNVRNILIATKGTYVQHPLLGAALVNQLNGFVGVPEKRKIRLNLEADGYRVKEVNVHAGKMSLEYVR